MLCDGLAQQDASGWRHCWCRTVAALTIQDSVILWRATWEGTPTLLHTSNICTPCDGHGIRKHCWGLAAPLLPDPVFWAWTVNSDWFVLGRAHRGDSPANTAPLHSELELRLLMASMFKAAAMKWHHYIMDISTDSAEIKSFWERRKKKRQRIIWGAVRGTGKNELASYQCDFYH